MDTRRTPSRTDWSFLRANFNGAESIYRRSRRRKNRNLREEKTFLARDKLRQIAEIERFILSSQEAKIETARIQSPREDVQNTLNSWNYAAEEMCPTGIGSGDTTLLTAAHRCRHISVFSTTFSVASAVSLSASGSVFHFRWPGETPCKEKNKIDFKRAVEVLAVLSARGDPAQNNLNKTQ